MCITIYGEKSEASPSLDIGFTLDVNLMTWSMWQVSFCFNANKLLPFSDRLSRPQIAFELKRLIWGKPFFFHSHHTNVLWNNGKSQMSLKHFKDERIQWNGARKLKTFFFEVYQFFQMPHQKSSIYLFSLASFSLSGFFQFQQLPCYLRSNLRKGPCRGGKFMCDSKKNYGSKTSSARNISR